MTSSKPTYESAILQMRAYRALRSQVLAVLYRFNINATQWAILGHLATHRDGVGVLELAQVLDVKPPLVTMMTTSLVKDGLVTREVSPLDGRAKIITLTEAGLKHVAIVESELRHDGASLFWGISVDEMSIYDKVLRTIIENDAGSQAS